MQDAEDAGLVKEVSHSSNEEFRPGSLCQCRNITQGILFFFGGGGLYCRFDVEKSPRKRTRNDEGFVCVGEPFWCFTSLNSKTERCDVLVSKCVYLAFGI